MPLPRRHTRPAGRSALIVVPSVVGTAQAPGAGSQLAALEDTGTVVLPSNAEAARFAALALVPDLAARLLGGARCASRRFWLDRDA